jgi:hypothetical protein
MVDTHAMNARDGAGIYVRLAGDEYAGRGSERVSV